MTSTTKRRGFWAWLPALLVIAGSIVTAAGISLIPSATAANVVVSGQVTGAVSITGSCGGAVAMPSFSAGDIERISPDCMVSFDTNATNGASLSVADNRGASAFYCVTASCSGNLAFDDTDSTTLDAGEFGIALEAAGGGGTPCSNSCAQGGNGAMAPDANSAVVAGDASFYEVGVATTGAAHKVCGSNAPNAGTATDCTFVFGGQSKAAQQADASYTGTAVFTAATNP